MPQSPPPVQNSAVFYATVSNNGPFWDVRGNKLLLLALRAHPFCFVPFFRFVHLVPLDLLRQLVLLMHLRARFFWVPRRGLRTFRHGILSLRPV